MVECPTCNELLEIPATDVRMGGLNEGGRLRSSVTERVRAQRRPSDTERFCAEFLEATLSTNLLEQELAEAEQELASLRELLAAPKPEPMRSETEYLQLQAEWCRANEERLLLHTSLITSQQQLAATETLLTLRERDLEELRTRLARTESESTSAHAEAAALQGEVSALRSDLAKKQAALREAKSLARTLDAAQAQLSRAQDELRRSEMTRDSLAADCRRLQGEAVSLQRDLHASTKGREFVKLRDAAARADTERASMAATLAATQAEMERLEIRERERCTEVERLHRERREADRRAGNAAETESRVHRANEVLRGILARQTIELEARYRDLLRFRRSQLGLKMLQLIFAITVAGVIGLALKVLPAVAMEF